MRFFSCYCRSAATSCCFCRYGYLHVTMVCSFCRFATSTCIQGYPGCYINANSFLSCTGISRKWFRHPHLAMFFKRAVWAWLSLLRVLTGPYGLTGCVSAGILRGVCWPLQVVSSTPLNYYPDFQCFLLPTVYWYLEELMGIFPSYFMIKENAK
jgi:hypothetical protein